MTFLDREMMSDELEALLASFYTFLKSMSLPTST